jgi:hypothetical protein
MGQLSTLKTLKLFESTLETLKNLSFTIHSDEIVSITQHDAETKAAQAFLTVLASENGQKIELDHHLVYHSQASCLVTMGSGSLAAMAIFETGWCPNMEVMICPFCDRDDADRI